jgi:hypothetical protein
LLLQAGMTAEALKLAEVALDANTRLDADSVGRLVRAASHALDFGHAEAARIVFQGLLAHVNDVQQRVAVLTGLARAQESGGDPRAAAESYLLAAVAAPDPQDPAALAAREAAGANLLRAGLHADARAVFEWIGRNARSVEARQAAERRLSRF